MSPLFGRPGRDAPRPAGTPARPDPPAPGVPPPRPVPEGVLLGGRYRVGRRLGSGGMATVHLARDVLLRRDVAVKVFRARATSDADLRLQEAEARLTASLNHYALTTLFDAGVEARPDEDPQVYLVMEYVDGTDLRTRLRQGRFEVSEACWLGSDLSEALDYVHQAGFVHRDIKPANVLLSTLRSAKPVVGKLADFGAASSIGQREPNEYTVGTAAYLSPEQVEGGDVVPASDVYSLGLVLLEAITGHVEYPGSVVESAFARLERDPRIPEDLPEEVAGVLRAMTARRPADRIGLTEAALGFQRFLVDDLVSRRPATDAAPDEAARLAALQRYDVADGAPDPTLEAITRVAGRALEAPIALVTLIDVDRVRLAARLGWDGTEMPRDVAFCTTTDPHTGRPWTVPDALADPRTAESPLVTGAAGVRAYAGAPLVDGDGHLLGALCVLDREPRAFSAAQLETLADLAGLVMHELEMRQATRRALFRRE